MAKELSIPTIAEQIPDEAAAYEFLERLRWDGRPVCPHCGSINDHYFLTAQGEGRKTRTGKVSARRVWKCRDCRKQFSVLTGTIFHGTKIPIRTWLFVVFEMCSSKNGVAAREIERKYKLTGKSAWFMTQRIREAMKRDPLAGLLAGTVEADETYIGGLPKNRHGARSAADRDRAREPGAKLEPFTPRVYTDKTAVFSLVDRETGEVRSQVMPTINGKNIAQALDEHVHPTAKLMTDQAKVYTKPGKKFPAHETVNHYEGEYVRGQAYTNTIEGFFSQLKRSIDGTHHAVSVAHLGRYLAEFDYRYSTRHLSDTARMHRLLGQVPGRRLSYRPLTND